MGRWSTAVLVLLAFSALAGCASDVTLQDERRTEPYAGLLARGAALRHRSACVQAEDLGAPPLAVHVREVTAPEGRRPGPLLVLQPGVMTDHATWRFLAPLLGERYDLLLVDPPGTGLSDKPDPERSPRAYTPTWLGRHTLRAVHRWSAERADRRPLVLVGHSLGSLSLLRGLADPATRRALPDVCARVESLVLITPPDLAMREVDEQLEKIARLDDTEVALGSAVGYIGAQIEEGVYESVRQPGVRALRLEADRLTRIVVDPTTRRPLQAMLRRFRPVDRCERPIWPAIRAQIAEHRRLSVPALILWGEEDDTLELPMAFDVMRQLPYSMVMPIRDAKHSPHQERPQEVFDRILWFLEEYR